MDPKWIAQKLIERGKTQAELAAHLKLAPPQLSKIIHKKRGISDAEGVAIRQFLGVNTPVEEVRPFDTSAKFPARSDMARDVPVLGTAWGGDTGDFTMNGETGEYMRRPPRFNGRADLFALYVQGNSMEPRYLSGELIYVEKTRPPQNGDHVVVELLPDENGTREAYLKLLMGITPTKVRLQQYNPTKAIEIDRRRVGQVLRVLTTMDLLGI